ncbi:uncharacterized protein BCR38DRAFT_455430 [Pseudomassariella vexata]|uniref:Uncharacterized protein n=1 Tax=Pseudomassariella vexata TaxID=1141098 RepID=A0A1Y2EA61_9PEZI|nr:uncharacterized protein BCR38DRAFT_455430 [Pseudomassariella vexata]ORY68449.1 hypothetical protein BCR38DRAFT_455430 [Pseudomassariella vexata]
MLPARSAVRSALPRAAARSARAPRTQQVRFQSSTVSSASSNNGPSSSSHFASGLAGGAAAAVILYATYTMTPSGKMASGINKTAKEANKKYTEAIQKLQQSTPDADQTVDYIKNFCYSYVSWIPGGRQYVDLAFKDVEKVREKHRDEVDKILNDAYRQFQDVSKSGLSLETAQKSLEVLYDLSKKIGALAGDALGDIIDNHPELKEKFGGSIEQLKQMGDQYGPEAKKQVDETWQQVRDVMSGGLSASNLDKARKLIEEKVEQVKKLGDEAWTKAMEQAKPYLDKNPKVKELVENNADVLKQGNVKELFEKAQAATKSGDMGELESYVNKAIDKTKSKGSQLSGGLGLGQYFDMLPQGGEIMPKLLQLKEAAEKHSQEGEKLLKETMEELRKVLDNKSEKAQQIVDNAKKEAK